MSAPEQEAPPAGEDIHLPGASILPVLTALGIMLTLIGITTFIELTIAGGILTLACAVRWIKDTRADLDELPLE